MTHIKAEIIIAAAALLAAACGSSSQAPTEELSRSRASIEAASAAGAENYPDAADRLRVATLAKEHAQWMVRDGDVESAKAMLKASEADADLSLALTRAHDAEAAKYAAKRRLELEGEQ